MSESSSNSARDTVSRICIDEKTDFFTWLPNCIVYEWGLSSDALAAALYLNGKPADWQCRPFDVKKHFKWGGKIWARVSRELKSVDLLHEKITSGGTELWFKLPEMKLTTKQKPTAPFGASPKGDSAKGVLLSNKDLPDKDLLKNKEINMSENSKKQISSKENRLSSEGIKNAFERLWEYYPVKKGKQNAYRTFLKLTQGMAAEEIENLTKEIWDGLVGMLQEHRWLTEMNQHESFKIFIPELPHGSTWFAQHRWEDEYEIDPEKFIAKIKAKHKPGRAR